MKVCYIFPGQGAQYVGMGEDIQRKYPLAKEVFKRANSLLGFDLSRLIFQGPLEELTQTANCQIAVFVVSLACLRALEAIEPKLELCYTAGLSLGEYTALVAGGALSFEAGLTLVRKRAQYMEEASQMNPGGMLSLIGLALAQVEKICAQADVEIANLNCPGQIVISGRLTSLEKAKEIAQSLGAKKIIPLEVAGAFHSSLMAPAKQRLTEALAEMQFDSPKLSVVSNVTAKEESGPSEIRDNLANQLVMRTRWEDSMRYISSQGVHTFMEIGPGKVLKGLLRKIDPELKVYNIEKAKDLKELTL